MKKILIIGKSSYIGTKFDEYIKESGGNYSIDFLSVRNNNWKIFDFSPYDVILHTAGLAHVRETEENKKHYYTINRDLVQSIASKSKSDGVRHFIFISSMSVYGIEEGTINRETIPKPKTNYGISKLQAEELLTKLETSTFRITILRPPMVYGRNCKGNYTRLSRLANYTLFFPKIDNRRSMIYIDNLSMWIKKVIDSGIYGIILPQNNDYINTSELVASIRKANNKYTCLVRVPKVLLKIFKIKTLNKLFGNLIYEYEKDNELFKKIKMIDLKQTIELSEEHK
ncbi:NAD-dependent epimerase/dehydratase family protein [Terribacillus sp. 7520-G]|uniref:NAD-dependent epimerase/dehydratase family protein n=1 Tax=Terribacillus sp. 7520-G TaxID=2025389 RepID=UPI000BA6E675|nr:NAD-dependent epimerase/dehydratase family protein [Terribacillus sp. 7520-G]PAD40401.1 NAD-dependent epimerase [Terribacillus sp. 7520-G]